ncbi:MAG: zinc ribbon domain-containing protein [Myxococcales bacterium]
MPSNDPDLELERRVGQRLRVGLPVATLFAATAVTAVYSVGPGLLALAAGTLLGAITLLWASVRSLTTDGMVLETDNDYEVSDDALDRKARALRAIKDLETEHAFGKLADDDYAKLLVDYRDDAKNALRDLDVSLQARRKQAEQFIRAHLDKGAPRKPKPTKPASVASVGSTKRTVCPGCSASNEPDALFCKGCGLALRAKESTDAS